jgi:hypothetical protein
MSRKDLVPEESILECVSDDKTMTIKYTFRKGVMVRTDISYGKGYKSVIEELEEQNKKLPKTKRKYMDDDGKIVGYLTAKKKGLV